MSVMDPPGRVQSLHLFMSYTRDDRSTVEALVKGLERLGHEVWIDERLTGGQEWWEEILSQIRRCDAMVVAISPAVSDSTASTAEREYARSLGKPLLPVIISPVQVDLLPPDLARLQFIDFSSAAPMAGFELAAAVGLLPPPPPLPDPLPAAPAIPMSYTTDLAALVHGGADLTPEQQYALVFQLREGLGKPADREGCLSLLHRLRDRRELLASVAHEVDAVLAAAERAPAAPPPPPPPGAPVAPAAPAVPVGSMPAAPEKPTSRRRWIVVAGVVVAILAAFGIIGALSGGDEPDPPPDGTALLDTYRDRCAGGDLAACDDLYYEAEVGSADEEFGSTCGGIAAPTDGGCEEALDPRALDPGAVEPVDVAPPGEDPVLDALWSACADGDLGRCDDLYFSADVGSEYEDFGSTCGGRTEETDGGCAG